MHYVASRFGYPNYGLSELSLVPISADNRRSTALELSFCSGMSEYSNCVGYNVLNNKQHRKHWEATISTRILRAPHILENPKVAYGLQNRPQTLPILSQMNPHHVTYPHIFKARFDIIPPFYAYRIFIFFAYFFSPLHVHTSLRFIDWYMVNGSSKELSTSIFKVYAVITNRASYLKILESSSSIIFSFVKTSSGGHYCFLEKRDLAAAALCPWFWTSKWIHPTPNTRNLCTQPTCKLRHCNVSKHSTPSFGSPTLNFPQNLRTIHRG